MGREEKKRKIERDQAKVWIHDFCMNFWSLSMKLYDFGMIFVLQLLRYGLLGFFLEINLVPFSRVLL